MYITLYLLVVFVTCERFFILGGVYLELVITMRDQLTAAVVDAKLLIYPFSCNLYLSKLCDLNADLRFFSTCNLTLVFVTYKVFSVF